MLIVFLLPFSMFFQKVLSLIKKKEHSKLFKFLILFWLRWVFTSLCGLLIAVASLTAELGSRVCGLQLPWPGGLTNCSSWASEHRLNVVAHGLRCSVTCGILLDQGSNPCPLHWRADSQPLYYQGSHKTFQLLKLSRIPFYKLCLQLYVYNILTLEKEMATHSSSLAWEIQWTEVSGGLQSMGL